MFPAIDAFSLAPYVATRPRTAPLPSRGTWVGARFSPFAGACRWRAFDFFAAATATGLFPTDPGGLVAARNVEDAISIDNERHGVRLGICFDTALSLALMEPAAKTAEVVSIHSNATT